MASDAGPGAWGSPGPRKKTPPRRGSGLTKLAGDEFGGGPRVPMVPGTWDHDPKPTARVKRGEGETTVRRGLAVEQPKSEESERKPITMSMLDAHIPQLVAAQSAFGAKAGLMRSTISQAEQEAMSAQAFRR